MINIILYTVIPSAIITIFIAKYTIPTFLKLANVPGSFVPIANLIFCLFIFFLLFCILSYVPTFIDFPSKPDPKPNLIIKLLDKQECPDNSAKIDAKTYKISNEDDHSLGNYKDRYKAVHGGEEPLEIDIKNAFCLQLTEVSVAEFKQFLNAGSAAVDQERLDLLKTRISIQKDTAPVQNVSKEDAEAYAVWLSEKTSQHWQLPTLAQWMASVTEQGEQSPVTNTLDNEPAPAKGEDNGKVQHLLGNLREWSRDECPGGRYQLLGRNYIAGSGVDMAYCNAPTLGAPGVGFRLVYQLDGE